ncbi:MAG TPA: GGDEF domain-containing protein [Candidatus Angelobacter sp.]|nr:GGDEF domain-containing protein [Candidatus Angelobacter sp.]
MPRSDESRPRDVAVLLLGAALPAAALAVVRATPPTELAGAGLPWLIPALAGVLVAAASALAIMALVLGAREGALAAVLGAPAAAGVAGGSLVLALSDTRGGLDLSIGCAALLAVAVAVADRHDMVVAGRGGRLRIAGVGLAAVGAIVVAGSLPALAGPVDAWGGSVLLGSAALAATAGLIARPPLLAGASFGLAIGALGLGVDRGDGLEAVIGLLALIGASLAGHRSMEAPRADTHHAPAPYALPPLAHALPDALLAFDGALALRDWNASAASLLGLDGTSRGTRLEDLLGVHIGDLPTTEGPQTVTALGGLEGRLHRAGDGIVAVVREMREPADDRLSRELRGTIEELLQARRTIDLQRAELERSTTVDPLTGVASRAAILDRLRVEIAQARRYQHPVALVLLDVDRFSEINARHGVGGGDALLREVALRMRLRVREADALGRAGSDGFLAILPHTDESGAATFADALRRRLAQRAIPIGDELVSVTVSVGVAVMRPGEDLDLDGLIARVGEALGSARSAGGDRIALDRMHGLARLGETRDDDPPAEADSTT